MLSFGSESSILAPQNDHSYPSLSQMSFSNLTLVQNQQMLESYSEMQTPNFCEPFENFENQPILEPNPDRICGKNSLVSKLISTFEDLGLDVEYLDESETEDEQNSVDCSFNGHSMQEPKETGRKRNSYKSTDVKLQSENAISPSALKQKLKMVTEYCLILRKELSYMSAEQENLRASYTKMIGDTVSTFKTVLSDFMRSQRASLDNGHQESGLEAQMQHVRRGYDQLSSIIEQKQQRISSLIIQNEHLSLENSMLHFQLEKFAKKHEKCKDVKEQYEIMKKTQQYYEKRVNELEEENHDLGNKIDCLQWNLKEANKNLSYTSEENQNYKEQLEEKYRKAFEETAQKLREKIQAQTYYKMKNEYPFNIEKIEQTPQSIDKNDVLSGNSDSSGDQPISKASNYTLNTSQFLKTDSNCYDSTKFSGKNIEDKERQLERLLNDIKMTNESTAQSSLASSLREGFRRQSLSRPKTPRF